MISTLNSNTNRISGLASGLDTETLVTQLTSVTQGKIDAAKQEKQVLEWKQEYYRDILNSLTKFNNTYFGSSLSELSIGKDLGKLTATSTNSDYVTAVGSSSSTAQSVFFSDIVSLASSAKVTSENTISGSLSAEYNPLMGSLLGGKSMKVTLNGISKTITLTNQNYADADAVAAELNTQLAKAFGNGQATVSAVDNTLTIEAKNSKIALSVTGEANGEACTYLGFAPGSSNRVNLSNKLSESNLATALTGDTYNFRINGVDFSFDKDTSFNNILSNINNSSAGVKLSYSSLTDTFTLTTKETGSASAVTYEDTTGNFLQSIFGTGNFQSGTDAIVKVGLDGAKEEADLITLVRTSNTFDIDGTTYTLNGKAAGTETENVTVTTAYSVDSMVDVIKGFVSEYNSLLDSINKKLNETYYKDFPPLTDSQKEGLSDSEQEKWTEKAKSGLLRNDLILKGIVNDLRNCLFDSVKQLGGSGKLGYIMTDIGITTKAYTDNGKLTIDETALRKALSSKPEEVLSLFTQKASISFSVYNSSEKKAVRYNESGLIWRLSDIVKTNLNKVGAKGQLVEMVGSPDTDFVGNTTYSQKLYDLNYKISDLNKKLTTQQDYYWSKFTAMETAINNLNSQSSWLTAQLSS